MADGRIGKGRETIEEKLEYYDENRDEFIENFLARIQNPKEPAIAGTIVLTPILVTLLVVNWLFQKLAAVPGNQYFNIASNFGITGLGAFYLNQTVKLGILLILGAFMVTGIGRFVKTRAGFRAEKKMDLVVSKIPLLGSIYDITKVTMDTILTGPEGLKEPAKLEVGDLRITAFKTGNRAEDGREVVFVPTSPNITTGIVAEVEEDDLIETTESAQGALTRVLSAGFGSSGEKPDSKED